MIRVATIEMTELQIMARFRVWAVQGSHNILMLYHLWTSCDFKTNRKIKIKVFININLLIKGFNHLSAIFF